MTSRLNHASAELVTHLRSHQGSTQEDIHIALSPGRPHVRPLDTARRMNNLRAGGWIDYEVNAHGAKLWYAVKADPLPTIAQRAKRAADGALPIVPPRTYNVMQGHWTPPASPAMRVGAFDYQRVASHGVRC